MPLSPWIRPDKRELLEGLEPPKRKENNMPGVDPPWDKPQETQYDEEAERKAREETCPKCGAANLKSPPDNPHYKCESWVDYRGRLHESGECKDRQIAKLREVLEEAREFLDLWLLNELNHLFQNSSLQERTKNFLPKIRDAVGEEP